MYGEVVMRGTIETRILKRSVTKHTAGTTLGEDYFVIADDEPVIVGAEGHSELNGVMAVIRALNNLYMSGAKAESVTLSIRMGIETSEQHLRDDMNQSCEYVKKKGIKIIGGNTFSAGEDDSFSVTATAYGRVPGAVADSLSGKLSPGDVIVMCGYAGEYGAALLASLKREKLRERFADTYLDKVVKDFDTFKCDVKPFVDALLECGVNYMHDISFGGVYRALFELAEYSNHGISVLHEEIPIRQDTIEVSEFFNINPYLLLGTGGVIAVCSEEKVGDLKLKLESNKVPYGIIGKITDHKERIICSNINDMKRSINFYEEDEIYRII